MYLYRGFTKTILTIGAAEISRESSRICFVFVKISKHNYGASFGVSWFDRCHECPVSLRSLGRALLQERCKCSASGGSPGFWGYRVSTENLSRAFLHRPRIHRNCYERIPYPPPIHREFVESVPASAAYPQNLFRESSVSTAYPQRTVRERSRIGRVFAETGSREPYIQLVSPETGSRAFKLAMC